MPSADYVAKMWGIEDCAEIRITRDYAQDYNSVFPEDARKFVIFDRISSKLDERNDNLWTEYAEIIESAFKRGRFSTLVCCPSYDIAAKIHARLKVQTKYLENKTTSVDDVMEELARVNSRLIIMAVARGKMLEGVEFVSSGSSLIDSVVVVGVPYSVPDEMYKWRLKRVMGRLGISSLNQQKFESEYFMHAPALITVKQAIGRAVRFPNDRVIVHLADRRFRGRFSQELSD